MIINSKFKFAYIHVQKTAGTSLTEALMMIDRIKQESLIKNIKIIELSKTKYRVLIGPFNDIKRLKSSFEKMNSLNFENLEILKNV